MPLLLEEVTRRPLWASAQASNAASLKILFRSGFVEVERKWEEGTERYMAGEVVTVVLR